MSQKSPQADSAASTLAAVLAQVRQLLETRIATVKDVLNSLTPEDDRFAAHCAAKIEAYDAALSDVESVQAHASVPADPPKEGA